MPHLLIVDDEAAFTDALASYFRRDGYEVTTAYTAAEARAAYDRVDADAVVLDVRLPDGSGLDVLDGFEEPRPPVSIKKTITPDYLICLEDGKKFKSLKRHLRTHFKLTPEEYRAKWGLPPDYPMVAPNYASSRSKLAKTMGLGRRRAD